jgi:hypothetical protein
LAHLSRREQSSEDATGRAEFADPNYNVSVEWLAARDAIKAAEVKHRDATLPARILLINGSPRSEHTCPGEMSKTYRLIEAARDALVAVPDTECEIWI